MAANTETRTVEVKCHCGGVHFTLDFPVAKLPIEAYFCSCSICRYNTGTLANLHATVPEGVEPKWIAPSKPEDLVSYTVPNVSYMPKSCPTCGCHIGAIGIDDGLWTLATALFTEHDGDIVKVTSHVFSNSAGDGGLAGILTHVRGTALPSWNPADEKPNPALELVVGADGQERLRAQCHCGGVSFTIPRPPKALAEHPYGKRFVSKVDTNKWLGTLDVCGDCRLVNGTPVASWIFAPVNLIEPAVGEDLQIGTTKTYKSSEGVTRAFCSVCSATIFFLQHSRRYDDVPVVDISTGLLRAPEGSMAENWITWRARSSFEGDGLAFDKDMAEGLIQGMHKWTDKRNEGVVLTDDI